MVFCEFLFKGTYDGEKSDGVCLQKVCTGNLSVKLDKLSCGGEYINSVMKARSNRLLLVKSN